MTGFSFSSCNRIRILDCRGETGGKQAGEGNANGQYSLEYDR